MKLGFLFDVRFTEYNGEYYSTNLTQDFWNKRYLKLFDEIVVVGRYVSSTEDPTGKLVKSSNEKVKFKCMKDSKVVTRILSQRRQSAFIEEVIKDCDRVICRGWWGVSACKKLGIPYLVEVVSCVWDSYWNHSLEGKLVAFPNYILQRGAVKEAPYVIYVTEKFLQGRYPARNKIIGVSDVELKEVTEAEKSRIFSNRLDKITSHNKKIVIGTAAAISVKYKGQKYVIKAIAELKKKGITNIEYQLAGTGSKDYLLSIARKYHVENQVIFLGAIPHEKMFEWYDGLDLYIQPSLQEGLPRALVEAMSRGVPCLGTSTGGIPELLAPECICDKRKNIAKQIAEKIEKLDEDWLVDMARRNFSVSENYEALVLDKKRLTFLKDFQDFRAGEENASGT